MLPYKILIAEDNRRLADMLREKLGDYPDLKVRACVPNGEKALEILASSSHFDLVLMDINMPVMNGIEATEKIKQQYPQIKVIMSTVFDEEEYILKAILAGASGYLLKDESAERLHRSILEVMEGGAPMSASVARKALQLIRHYPQAVQEAVAQDYKLTPRETEILEQLATGRNYNEIADNLYISSGTVRKHIENIYQKLQVHNKVEAVQLAIKNRLI